MKKIVCSLLCLLLTVSLSSCSFVSMIDVLKDSENKSTQGTATTDVTTATTPPSSTPDDGTPDNGTPDAGTPDNGTPDAGTPDNGTPGDSRPNNGNLENPNNGILKSAHVQNMTVPENMKYLDSKEATEENNTVTIEATVVLYALDGDVVNWTTENDYIYVITKGNNRLVIIDSRSMTPIYNVPLAGVPAEMNLIGDQIYISLPDLCKIDIFSKEDCTKESSLFFNYEVSSFCIEDNFIYYSEHDQHCRVFKKDLTTGTETQIQSPMYFYFPKLYLNREDRILYIGESQSSGSTLYYYDADTLILKSTFKKDDYGIMNHTREIFHVEDKIYWGNYCLSDTDAKQQEGRYGTHSYGSTVFVSKELVSTYEGLFLTDTYECVIDYFESGFTFEYLLISDSYNIFFRSRSNDKNIIIGINFDRQDGVEM